MTLHDVAARAGVSIGTVSNYLRGNVRVSPETAERVREAIDDLGYVANAAARTLKTGRTNTFTLAVDALLEPVPDFDAVLACDDMLALGVMRRLLDRGRGIPDDVRVIGMDDVDQSRYAVPTLSTVDLSKQTVAEAEAVAADESATQEAIDAAKDALIDAQSKLIKVTGSDIGSGIGSDSGTGGEPSAGSQSDHPANRRVKSGSPVQGGLPRTGVAVLGLAAVALIVAAAGIAMVLAKCQDAKES